MKEVIFMNYVCKKCKSEFSLEKDAADIYCPYCSYLAKSDDRNKFYEQVKVIKPILTKKEFVISQLEKMAKLEDTPKDVFDNLDYNVQELYMFYAVRKAKYVSSYEATVQFMEKETFTYDSVSISKDENGNKIKTTKPVEDTRTVKKDKIVSDFLKFDDSIVINYKGVEDKDLDIISNYKNTFVIDNEVEVPMKVVRTFLNYRKENETQFDERCKSRLDVLAKEKIIDRYGNYDRCMNIELSNKEIELGEYDIYCVTKYVWEYKYDNSTYKLQNLSCLKHTFGEYPKDLKITDLINEKKEEIDNESKKLLDSIYATVGVMVLILGIIIYFVSTSKDNDFKSKTFIIVFLVCFFAIFAIPICIVGYFKNKKILKKKEAVEKKLKDEKQEKKDIMCIKQTQKIKNDEFKL